MLRRALPSEIEACQPGVIPRASLGPDDPAFAYTPFTLE